MKSVNRDVIQRKYLQEKLQRDKRKHSLVAVRDYIASLQVWVRDERKRTKRAGGL